MHIHLCGLQLFSALSCKLLSSAASVLKQTFVILGKIGAYDTSLNMHTATEAQRLLDAHQVAHRAAVSLRQAQIHSATWHCACAQSSIEALTTREAALRSEVALLETEHAVKNEDLEASCCPQNPRTGASAPQATKLNPKLNLYADNVSLVA